MDTAVMWHRLLSSGSRDTSKPEMAETSYESVFKEIARHTLDRSATFEIIRNLETHKTGKYFRLQASDFAASHNFFSVMMDPDIGAFMRWFQSSGGVVDTKMMGITEFPGSGHGAIALNDIPEGHTLFTLPRALTLSTRTSPLPSLFGIDAWREHGLHRGWTGLILCMMWEDVLAHELDQGWVHAQSKWGTYMRTLPERFDTPMFWSAEELTELEGTSVIDKIGRDDAERAYTEQLIPAIKSSPTLFPPAHHSKWYTLEAYHRAGSRILSRSFTVSCWGDGNEAAKEDTDDDGAAGESDTDEVEDPLPETSTSINPSMHVDNIHPLAPISEGTDEELDSNSGDDQEDDTLDVAMVPMADLLNAKWGSENAKLFHEPLVLRMVTTKDIKRGEQIFNTYGDLPNSDLLRRYGHVDLVPLYSSSLTPTHNTLRGVEMKDSNADTGTIMHLGNPSDVAEIRADLVVHVVQATNHGSPVKDVHARIEWWLDEGEDDTFMLTLPGSGSPLSAIIPPALVSLTRLLILSESDFKSARSNGKLPKGKLKKGDGKNNKRVLEILNEVFKRREEMYTGGNVEDDELLSFSERLTERKRCAVIVRLGEKRIIKMVRQEISTLLTESGAAHEGVKGHMRRDKLRGKDGKEAGSNRKRVIDGVTGRCELKKARNS